MHPDSKDIYFIHKYIDIDMYTYVDTVAHMNICNFVSCTYINTHIYAYGHIYERIRYWLYK